MKADGVRFLSEGCRYSSCPSLRVLDLTHGSPFYLSPADNHIGEKGICYLVSMLRDKSCPRLEELSLISMLLLFSSYAGNDLHDKGLLKLLCAVKFGLLSHLRILYLSDNKLQDPGVRALIAHLKQCKIASSAELHIGCRWRRRGLLAGNRLSNEVVQELVSLLYLPLSAEEPILKYLILEKSNQGKKGEE